MERGFLVKQFISNNIWHRHLHISIFTFLPPLKIFYQLWTSSVQIKFCGTGEQKRVHTIYISLHMIYRYSTLKLLCSPERSGQYECWDEKVGAGQTADM